MKLRRPDKLITSFGAVWLLLALWFALMLLCAEGISQMAPTPDTQKVKRCRDCGNLESLAYISVSGNSCTDIRSPNYGKAYFDDNACEYFEELEPK